MALRRYLDVGAVWAWPLGAQPLQEARSRYTVTGNPTVGVGPWGPYLTFDGAADYVTLTAAEEHLLRFDSGSQDFSILVWMRTSAGGAQVLIDKQDAGADGWYFATNGANLQFTLNGVGGFGPPAVIVNDGNWHSGIVVVDRSVGYTVYIDGQAGLQLADPGRVMATTTAPRIGRLSYSTVLDFNGDLAGIVIADRAYSAEECADIASGTGPF